MIRRGLIGICLLACATPALAHHGAGSFDLGKSVTFTGVLTKIELINREEYPTRKSATKSIARYIELYYNSRRFHSTLGYQTPQEVLDEYQKNSSAA